MSLNVVGWLDDFEWYLVYKNLFEGELYQQKLALERIKIWRKRISASIPVAIEVTMRLMECKIAVGNINNESVKQQLLGGAVSQFVGLITEKGLKGMGFGYRKPIHILGEELGIPHWIINLRHEAVHGLLPSTSMLEKAVEFGINWIKLVYWEEQASHLTHLNQDNLDITEESVVKLLCQYSIATWRECYPEVFNEDKVTKNARMEIYKKLKMNLDCNKSIAKNMHKLLFTNNIITYEANSDIITVAKSENSLPNFNLQFQRCWRIILHYINNIGELHSFLIGVLDELEYHSKMPDCYLKVTWYVAWFNLVFSTMEKEIQNIGLNHWSEMFKIVCCFENVYFKEKMLIRMLNSIKNICSEEQYCKLLNLTNIKDNDIENFDISTMPESTNVSRNSSYADLNKINGAWKICDLNLEFCPLGLLPGQDTMGLLHSLAAEDLFKVLKPKCNSGDDNYDVSDDVTERNSYSPHVYDKTETQWTTLAKNMDFF